MSVKGKEPWCYGKEVIVGLWSRGYRYAVPDARHMVASS